ncbi:hypothetical protein KZZ52_27945 [Dactylosporangium sp. AC04546]|uniref:hypothetical protein n=1 Tax=Dactylosporangium sp. AC04546 TaxID=2862460 RepID=UPI001EDFE754|nr:hypothetical protein [Dactylosporangium sp. AC04546]WVK89100.1 hypothetical protein KZZ52_27945 [Dactylosporangium sp. AC04546]
MTELPFARSPEECLLYMELHPCRCGEADFLWSEHRLLQIEAQLASAYEGDCPGCGRRRRFTFAVSEEIAPPPAFGGAEPSRIIEPHEFLTLSRRAAAFAGRDPARMSETAVEDGLGAVETAIAALEEVLKFIPAGADAVPASAFVSPAGRAAHAGAVRHYERAALEAELASFHELERAYARRLGATP